MSLKALDGRVIVKIDTQFKNHHTFSHGVTIRLERQWNNLNKSQTEPLQGFVIDAEHIPTGAEVLCHHNVAHPINEISNYHPLSGEEIASAVKLYSVPEVHCYIWRMPGEQWQPLTNFVIADRVFIPYTGPLLGQPSRQIKNVLYIKTGHLKGKVCCTVRASDYAVIFRNEKGVEQTIIRARHYEDGSQPDREELTGVHELFTEMVQEGKLFLGISPSDAKPIIQETCLTIQ